MKGHVFCSFEDIKIMFRTKHLEGDFSRINGPLNEADICLVNKYVSMQVHVHTQQGETETERQRERFNHTGFNYFLELIECYSAYRYSLVQLNDTDYKLTQAKKEIYGTKFWKDPRTNLPTVVSQRTYGEHCLLQITM